MNAFVNWLWVSAVAYVCMYGLAYVIAQATVGW